MSWTVEALCKEIGDNFWGYHEENGRYGIDNGEKIYWYNSKEELLEDWADTLVLQHHDSCGTDGTNWEDAVKFVYEEVVGRLPKGIRKYEGKRKTSYSVRCPNRISSLAEKTQMVFVGNFESLADACYASMKWNYGWTV